MQAQADATTFPAIRARVEELETREREQAAQKKCRWPRSSGPPGSSDPWDGMSNGNTN